MSNDGAVRVPDHFDRLIVHQFDPARSSPGGIDTCLRGISKYSPHEKTFGFVGVDTGGGPDHRVVGRWEQHVAADGHLYWFIPVAKLDPAVQRRRIPHSLRLVLGVLRFRRRLPRAKIFQAHRMDTAWALRRVLADEYSYFIHTQENGLTGTTSDSFWRLAGKVHRRLEQSVVRRASQVVVFNEHYAEVVRHWNHRTLFSPTWYDPAIVQPRVPSKKQLGIVWVGRLERPKDPLLAIAAFARLMETNPSLPATLSIAGSGTLAEACESLLSSLPRSISEKVRLLGRVEPEAVARLMAESNVFLMTSHPGYEGYPRVLVEALASGLPSVVTDGSDTGGLIRDSVNGFVVNRDADQIASKILQASRFRASDAVDTVVELSAPAVISRIYGGNA